jgi:hypothetical protein
MPTLPEIATSHQESAQVQDGPSLTILRTDTVFAKLPIHSLTKSVPIDIRIDQTNAEGVQQLYWSVSPSSDYGPPQLLAYKLDTLVINRQLDTLKRPLPSLICLGSLRQICQELGLSRGKSTGNLKRAFHQNAGVYITAKLHYRDREGNQRRLEAGFHRYGVIFTGESLPDGSAADAVYITLHESYRQVLNSAPTRPIDYDYLTDLKPLAQRFYELLSFKMYAALKYHHPQLSMRYSELCQFAPQQRYLDGVMMSKQMYKVHLPHLQSGYLADITTQSVLDDQGRPDWLLQYTPGPKAWTEYHAFTGRNGRDEPALRTVKPVYEPPVTRSERTGSQIPHLTLTDGCNTSAAAVIQQFYQAIHGVANPSPQAKEIEHAMHLIETHGWEFATFFVDFACQTARRSDFTPHVFGGLMRYEGRALAAYRRQQAKRTREAAEAAADREARLHQQYEQERRVQLSAYRDGLSPAELATLNAQVRAELMATETIPRSLLSARLKAELHDRLALQAGVPPYEAWLRQREKTSHGKERSAAGVGPKGDRAGNTRKALF